MNCKCWSDNCRCRNVRFCRTSCLTCRFVLLVLRSRRNWSCNPYWLPRDIWVECSSKPQLSIFRLGEGHSNNEKMYGRWEEWENRVMCCRWNVCNISNKSKKYEQSFSSQPNNALGIEIHSFFRFEYLILLDENVISWVSMSINIKQENRSDTNAR